MSEFKNKHALNGLTLRDLKDTVDAMRVYSLTIDGQLWERFEFTKDGFEIWETNERCYHNEPADRVIDLDAPVKVREGGLIVKDPNSGEEETIVFGQVDFVPSKIKIDIV